MKYFFTRHGVLKRHFYSFVQGCFVYSRGFIILTFCLWFGTYISALLPIIIPGSIIGLLTLFFLLTFHLIPADWIKNSCNLFMRYMALLFIPAAMGIMDNYVVLLNNWAPILIAAIVSSVVVLIFSAFLTEYLHRTRHPLPNSSTDSDTHSQKDKKE